jgi:hypothetical protein
MAIIWLSVSQILGSRPRPRWAAAQRRFESIVGKEAAPELRAVLKELATAEFG